MADNKEVKKKSLKGKVKQLEILVVGLLFLLTLSLIFLAVQLMKKPVTGNNVSADIVQAYNELQLENEELKARLESVPSVEDNSDSLNEEIQELTEIIAANASLMEDLGIKEGTESIDAPVLSEAYYYLNTDWNLLKNTTVSSSGGKNSTDFIRVNPKYYYCMYASTGNVSVSSYSEDYALIDTVRDDASTGLYFTFDDNCYYIKVSYSQDASKAILVSTGITRDDPGMPLSRKAFYVVSKNSPVKIAPSTAVNMLLSGGTVLILPGVYNDQISAQSKLINLIGVNRSECVIQSTSCDYYTPPLEVAAGTVSNLTFKAVNSNSAITDLKAYAIHTDYDYGYGRKLTISNCTLSSDFNAGLGVGLRGNGSLKISNCTISGKEKGIFLHDCDREDFGGNQKFVMESCTVTSVGNGPAVHLHSQCMSNANISLSFTGNSLNTTGSSQELLACTTQNGGTFADCWNNLDKYHLVSGSGNNISSMNQ